MKKKIGAWNIEEMLKKIWPLTQTLYSNDYLSSKDIADYFKIRTERRMLLELQKSTAISKMRTFWKFWKSGQNSDVF